MRRAHALIVFFGSTLPVGCGVSLGIPDGLLITCRGDSDCPDDYACNRNGLCEERGLASDQNAPPTVSIGEIAPPGATPAQRFVDHVVLPVTVRDDDGQLPTPDTVTLTVEFSTDYDPSSELGTWTAATLTDPTAVTDLSASAEGISYASSIVWDAYSDALAGAGGLSTTGVDADGDGVLEDGLAAFETVFIRITPEDSRAKRGVPDVSSPFAAGNDHPELVVLDVSASGDGAVLIDFSVSDSSAHLSEVEIQFRDGVADAWRPILLRAGRLDTLAAPASGLEYVVAWNSNAPRDADVSIPQGIGTVTSDAVELRLRSFDHPAPGVTHRSAWQTLPPLTVTNQTPPWFETLFVNANAPTSSGAMGITYRLYDEEADPVDVLFEYSIDGGQSWSPCTEYFGSTSEGLAKLSALPSADGGVVHDFAWDIASDIFVHAPDTRIRTHVADETGAAGPFNVALAVPTGPLPDRFPFVDMGTFQDSGMSPSAIAVGDLNGDTHIDVVLSDFNSDALRVFYNAGDGTFGVPPASIATLEKQRDVLIADLDGTGEPDIVVVGLDADDGAHVVVVLDGGAGAAYRYTLPQTPGTVSAGDVNSDDAIDLIVTTFPVSTSVYILEGAGNGTFAPASFSPIATHRSAHGATVADVDGDGMRDLVIGAEFLAGFDVAYGNGNGLDNPVSHGTSSDSLWDPLVADLDADGVMDVLGVGGRLSGTGEDQGERIFRGLGNRTFAASQTFYAGSFPRASTVADVDDDGHPDVLVANDQSNDASILLNRSTGGQVLLSASVSFRAEQGPVGITAADFDGDGTVDFAVANAERWGFSLFLASSAAGFSPLGSATSMPVVPFTIAVTTADINVDGRPDILAAGQQGEVVTGLVSRSGAGMSGGLFETANFATEFGATDALVADLNEDGAMDVALTPRLEGAVTMLGSLDSDGFPTGGFEPFESWSSTYRTDNLAVADFDGNGVLDIVVTSQDRYPGYNQGAYEVLLGTLDGSGVLTYTSQGPVSVTPTLNPHDVGAADVDLNGTVDLLMASWEGGSSSSNGFFTVVPGKGDGSFGTPKHTSVGSSAYSFSLADFDFDGVLDVVVIRSLGVLVLLRGNTPGGVPDGTYSTAFTCSVGTSGAPHIVGVADLNMDGWLDLVSTFDIGDEVVVLLGTGPMSSTCNESFSAPVRVLGTDGHWEQATADVDLDGAPDLLVTDPLGATVVRMSGRPTDPRDGWRRIVWTADIPLLGGALPAETSAFGARLGVGFSQNRVFGIDSAEVRNADEAFLSTVSFIQAAQHAGVLPPGYAPLSHAWRISGDRQLRRVPDPAQPDQPTSRRRWIRHRFGPVSSGTGDREQRAGLDLTQGRGMLVDLPILDTWTNTEAQNATDIMVVIRSPDWLRADEACRRTPVPSDPICTRNLGDAHQYLPVGNDGRDIIQRADEWVAITTRVSSLSTGSGPRFALELLSAGQRRARVLTDRFGIVQAFAAP